MLLLSCVHLSELYDYYFWKAADRGQDSLRFFSPRPKESRASSKVLRLVVSIVRWYLVCTTKHNAHFDSAFATARLDYFPSENLKMADDVIVLGNNTTNANKYPSQISQAKTKAARETTSRDSGGWGGGGPFDCKCRRRRGLKGTAPSAPGAAAENERLTIRTASPSAARA